MKLHDAIKQLIAQFGKDIVAEVRLANLVADLNGYEDYPAMKHIFKESLKDGYGKKILEQYNQSSDKVLDKTLDFVKELSRAHQFKEDLVSYGFDCILFGLGCLTSINEPISKGFDPYSKGNEDILGNLDNMLSSYQKQYLDLLDRLVTKPKDIQRDAPGYYSAEALNKLYAIEAKIHALQQELGKVDKDWCKKQREAKLDFYKKQKSDAVVKTLPALKDSYTSVLDSSIVIPNKFFIKRSGYYTEDTLTQLASIEENIKYAYYNMAIPYDDWCFKEYSKRLEKYKVEASSIALQFLGKIGVPAAIFIGASSTGVSYVSSSDAITQFEETIQKGEQNAANREYGKALQLFNEAKVGYDASFRPSHYQEVAEEHISNNIDKVAAECSNLVGQNKLVEASSLIKSLPQQIVSSNSVYEEKVKNAKAELDAAIDEGLGNLISSISQNQGHLDAKTKAYLDELLRVNPNEYWLNFIKNKEK